MRKRPLQRPPTRPLPSEPKPINGWRRVVFAGDCDEDGNCPECGTDYAECPCPGPTQDGYEYRESRSGWLEGRRVLQ